MHAYLVGGARMHGAALAALAWQSSGCGFCIILKYVQGWQALLARLWHMQLRRCLWHKRPAPQTPCPSPYEAEAVPGHRPVAEVTGKSLLEV